MTDTTQTGAPGAPDYTWGPQKLGDGRWRFRLWAPGVESLTLSLRGESAPMEHVGDGWFAATAPAVEGDPYAFVLPNGLVVPDPAARRSSGRMVSTWKVRSRMSPLVEAWTSPTVTGSPDVHRSAPTVAVHTSRAGAPSVVAPP